MADAVLILQCLYYDYMCSHGMSPASSIPTETGEDLRQPLLAQKASGTCSPSSRRQPLTSRTSDSIGSNNASFENPTKHRCTTEWVSNSASLLIVCILGILGWGIAWKIGLWLPASSGPVERTTQTSLGAMVLGYTSAICYLGYEHVSPVFGRR